MNRVKEPRYSPQVEGVVRHLRGKGMNGTFNSAQWNVVCDRSLLGPYDLAIVELVHASAQFIPVPDMTVCENMTLREVLAGLGWFTVENQLLLPVWVRIWGTKGVRRSSYGAYIDVRDLGLTGYCLQARIDATRATPAPEKRPAVLHRSGQCYVFSEIFRGYDLYRCAPNAAPELFRRYEEVAL